MLQSGHDFQGQGQMTLKIKVKVKGHYMQHTLSFFQGQRRKIKKICQKFKFPDSEKKCNTRHTL